MEDRVGDLPEVGRARPALQPPRWKERRKERPLPVRHVACVTRARTGKPAADGKPQTDSAIPAFGYKSHISIDRRHGLIRRAKVTDAAANDGARRREGLIDPNNTACDVWVDSAYRSADNERYLADIGRASRIHRRKPKDKPMPKHTARANTKRSAVRAHVERPFAHQKGPMGRVIRTIGIARATATVMLTNMAYNMRRWCWLDGRSLPV